MKLARAIERSAREEAQDKARDIVITAMQRVASEHTAEHTVSVVHLPSDEMKGRIIGREGRNIRALEQATGIDLIIDDTPETVILSGFDPVRREVARLAITKLIADGRIHPGRIEEVVAKARAEVEVVMRQAGEQAAYDAGVPGLPADIIKTLGRLKFRTSFGQNVLNHVVETSHLAAIIAAEIGADVQVAKMGGLLHDVGKALDHEVEGPHAAIGASLAQRHNLPPKVINAIAAHHQEVEYTCLEAPIVQIADAISASRPGARGESMDTYVKRLEDLQAIAESFGGVERSFAVQAGREVRILVRPEEIDDLTASPARPRHRQEDRGAADLPGPDQGHGHPRDAGRGVREVAPGEHGSPGPVGRTRLGNPTNGNLPRPPGACRVLMIGDLIGKPGRIAVEAILGELREERGIDFVTANGENVAGGMGLTASTADSLLAAGVDVITSGNHIWDKREIYGYLETSERVLRPLNYGEHDVPGSWLGHLPGARRDRRRRDQPAGPDLHAADREPVHRRRPAARRVVRAAAAGPPGRLPLRADVGEERPGRVPRRPGQRGRRDPHPRRDRRRADPARRHGLPDRPRDDRADLERHRLRAADRAATLHQRAADPVRGGRRGRRLQRQPDRHRSGDRPRPRDRADPAAHRALR